MNFRNLSLYFIILSFVTYGQFYHQYKFSDPNLGNNDYFNYKEMIIKPLSIDATGSPFVYRQFTTLVSKVIYDLGIFYDSKIVFTSNNDEKRVYFSILLSNFIGIFLCLFSLIFFLTKYYHLKSVEIIFFPILLITSSFGYIFSGLSVLTEGWTYFFNLLIFLFFIHGRYLPFLIISIISILNKEISVIYITMFIFFNIIHDLFFAKKINISRIKYISTSLLSFLLYTFIRKIVLPTSGHEGQLEPTSWIENLTNFSLNTSFIFQGILSVGVFGILILLSIYSHKIRDFYNDKYLFGITFTIFSLYILGLMTGIGNNIGRIVSSISPIISFLIVIKLIQKNEKTLLN
jgi:hypothetical protein